VYVSMYVRMCMSVCLSVTLVINTNFTISCQTYEGGIGGEPYNEAHGGYTFCGVAALILIDRYPVIFATYPQ